MKLSICVPTYNKPKLITDTIKNISDICDGIDYELLILDDCSKDDTIDRVREVYNNLPHDVQNRIITYKNQENLGVTKSWNKLVSEAKGDFICVINNDVIFPKGFFEKLIAGFTPEVGLVCCRFTEGDSKNPSVIKYYPYNISGHCYMIKQEDKDKFFPLDERLVIFGSDNWLYYRIKELGYGVKVVKDAICHHLKSQTVFFMPNRDITMFYKICDEEGWCVETQIPSEDDVLSDIIF